MNGDCDYCTDAAGKVSGISQWIDTSPANAARDREALGWSRVTKVTQEAGEAVDAWELHLGGNPRKPVGPLNDVIEELLDAAIAALGGVEHLTGNSGVALGLMFDKIDRVHERAMQS